MDERCVTSARMTSKERGSGDAIAPVALVEGEGW